MRMTVAAVATIGGLGLTYYALFAPGALLSVERRNDVAGSQPLPSSDLVGPTYESDSERFREAVGYVESRGRYDAVGPDTQWGNALGKYQILPGNWARWAKRWLGNGDAPTTPYNQDTVARAAMADAYSRAGSWRKVAGWWHSGKFDESAWGPTTRRYVELVMSRYG